MRPRTSRGRAGRPSSSCHRTAEPWFAWLGYATIDRASVPGGRPVDRVRDGLFGERGRDAPQHRVVVARPTRVCDPPGMDGVLAIAVAGLAIALAAALTSSSGAPRTSRRCASTPRAGRGHRRARRPSGSRTRRWRGRDPGSPAPVGILHLNTGNQIKHEGEREDSLLGATPGRLPGPLMEAFLDARRGLLDAVPVGGSATGELRVGAAGRGSSSSARTAGPPTCSSSSRTSPSSAGSSRSGPSSSTT